MSRSCTEAISAKIEDIDAKIAYHQVCIKKLEQKKESLLNPVDMKEVAKIVRASGLTLDEITKRLSTTG